MNSEYLEIINIHDHKMLINLNQVKSITEDKDGNPVFNLGGGHHVTGTDKTFRQVKRIIWGGE
ncbi:MAG TPA: hypothetical protein VFH42_00250 [Sporolactobacillaceae bacterium]|nr:hypothetical protein [Sporolactobacillaceae bacterium]